MNVVCLAIDRLHAGYLGALGNAWVETPAFDRLASQSWVYDQAMIDTPELVAFYRSFWRVRHALSPEIELESLPALARARGVHTALLTDASALSDHPLADDFDELSTIDPPWQTQLAAEFEETHLARCFVELTDWLRTARSPYFLHCHLGSLGTVWDAPLDLRERFRDDDDPEPLETAEVPDRVLAADADPDDVLRYSHAYAGQLTLLDTCLSGLVEAIDEHPTGKETMLILMGTRGFPLGEHGRLGPCDSALYGELAHVPLLLRGPHSQRDPAHSQQLVEPADISATIATLLGGECQPPRTGRSLLNSGGYQHVGRPRDRLVAVRGDGERVIRTPGWQLHCGPERSVGPIELYAKPDDYWEANNVAVRCPHVVEGLLDALEQFERAAENEALAELPPLDTELLEAPS